MALEYNRELGVVNQHAATEWRGCHDVTGRVYGDHTVRSRYRKAFS
jgi:hypothetical protein